MMKHTQRMMSILAVTAISGALVLSGCNGKEEVAVDEKPATVFVERPAPLPRGGTDYGAQLYEAAAEKLEVTLEALTDALGSPPDFEAAAEKLGIAIEKIREAIPQFEQMGQGGFGDRDQVFAQAAEMLKVSLEELTNAIGRPPNLEAAAEKLEISIEKLKEALPFLSGRGAGRQGAGQN